MIITDWSKPLRKLLIDRWYLHNSAYISYRMNLTSRFMISGPIKVLNIGPEYGLETLKLLRRGNYVTVIDNDPDKAQGTSRRIERHGFADRYKYHIGHVLSVEVSEQFDEVYMCEVLEHIAEDLLTLQRISNWLYPRGRLIMSTPTASYGQLVDESVCLQEDGGHVRIGYDGAELDRLLEKVGLFTLRRVYFGNPMLQWLYFLEKWLRSSQRRIVKLLGYGSSLLMRPFLLFLDLWTHRPFGQITLAIKKDWEPHQPHPYCPLYGNVLQEASVRPKTRKSLCWPEQASPLP
jgi:SAM-dependent methyltransferase